MNNAPLTLILIAAIGLIVVLSLGVFFAVKPKHDSPSSKHLFLHPRSSSAPSPTTHAPPSTTKPQKSLNYNVENGELRKSAETYQKPPPLSVFTRRPPPPVVQDRVEVSRSSLGFRSRKPPPLSVFTRRPPPPVVQDRVEVVANPPVMVQHSPPPLATFPVRARTPRPSSPATPTQPPHQYWTAEKRMMYGKVVGLAFHDGLLYAPSHDAGNISVLSTPDLKLVEELQCPKCRIYDLAVLPNGDLVVAQGKRQKLSKMSREEGRIVKEIHLDYATKGLAVSPDGRIFVLTRSHQQIKVYNEELEEVGLIFIPNDNQDDCNFLTVDRRGRLVVSCETEVFMMESGSGEYAGRVVAPGDTSYSMGVAVGPAGELLLSQRGRSLVDVYSEGGDFLHSLGARTEALWSDIAFGNAHVYVIDYIAATVKAIPF